MNKCINCTAARRVSADIHRSTLVGCYDERTQESPILIKTDKDVYEGWADNVYPESERYSGAMSRIMLVPHGANCKYFEERTL